MKAMIRKELRENTTLAALGLLAFAILTLGSWRYYIGMIDDVARETTTASDHWFHMQPIASDAFLAQCAVLCGVFGALLGWMQIFRERHRDLWAYLVHRPVSRTTLFAGKVTAGLLIYSLVVGIPLLLFVLWEATPGHVAAPFEWKMAVPVLERFLAGMGAYFAGMLTGLRQARWYASRALGLGLGALVVFWSVFGVWVGMAIGIGILALAAWGNFLGGGSYRNQPAWGKAATTIAMGVGSFVVMATVLGLLMLAFFRAPWSSRGWSYVMTKDGSIFREEYRDGTRAGTELVEGKPQVNAADGQPLTQQAFDGQRSESFLVEVNFENRARPFIVSDANDYCFFLDSFKGRIWYFWKKSGRIVGYDAKTRALIGSTGPEGFAATAAGNGSRFTDFYGSQMRGVIEASSALVGTPTGLYQAHLNSPGAREIFKTTADDPIGGAHLGYLGGRSIALAVTRKTIHVLRPDARPGTQKEWTVPYQPGYPDYSHIQVSMLEKPERFAVWIEPHAWIDSTLKRHVTWLTEDGSVAKTADLPPLPTTAMANNWTDTLSGMFFPSVVALSTPIIEGRPWPSAIPFRMLNIGLIGGAICALVGLWLCRRHSVPLGAQLGWSVFHLACGPAGLIAFICVQEWAVREECPNCRKQRSVDRERCEHCGAEFVPPPKNGTEIFEPLTTV